MKKFGLCLALLLTMHLMVGAQTPTPAPSQGETATKPTSVTTPVVDAAAKAKMIMLAARKAMGGEALTKIKDVTVNSTATLTSELAGLEVTNETIIKYPNKSTTKVNGVFGEVRNGYDGTSAWAKTPGDTKELVGDNANEFRNILAGDTLLLLNQFDSSGYQIEWLAETKFNDREANIVQIKTPVGHEVKLYVDKESSFTIGRVYKVTVAGMSIENEEYYTDFHVIEGVQIPFTRSIKRNGQSFANVAVETVKFNTGVEDSIFTKPKD